MVVNDHDEFPNRGDGLVLGRITVVMHPLVLQTTPEALHGRVVMATAFPGHRGSHATPCQELLISGGVILAAAVHVVNQAGRRPFFVEPPGREGFCRQLRLKPTRHFPNLPSRSVQFSGYLIAKGQEWSGLRILNTRELDDHSGRKATSRHILANGTQRPFPPLPPTRPPARRSGWQARQQADVGCPAIAQLCLLP